MFHGGILFSQAQRRSDTHQNPEQWRFLQLVQRRQVRHAVRAGAALHGEPGAAADEEWRGHRPATPPQLRRPHHGEVSAANLVFALSQFRATSCVSTGANK